MLLEACKAISAERSGQSRAAEMVAQAPVAEYPDQSHGMRVLSDSTAQLTIGDQHIPETMGESNRVLEPTELDNQGVEHNNQPRAAAWWENRQFPKSKHGGSRQSAEDERLAAQEREQAAKVASGKLTCQ